MRPNRLHLYGQTAGRLLSVRLYNGLFQVLFLRLEFSFLVSLSLCKSPRYFLAVLMLKTWPLCTGAKLNLGDRVLDKIEKNSLIVFLGKVGHRGLLPLETVCPILKGLMRGFMAVVLMGLLTRFGGAVPHIP